MLFSSMKLTSFLHSSPLDYTFVTLGDDWPSAYEPDSENATSVVEHKRLRNPFRLAKEWALRRRRRS